MIKKGDFVETIDDQIKGSVIAVLDGIVTIITADGFELEFTNSELVKLPETSLPDLAHVPSEALEEKRKGGKKRGKKTLNISSKSKKEIPPMEVDLHIGQLTRSTKGMTSHEMRSLQLDTAQRQLDFAFAKRILRIVFIHGVGDGILKADLEALFKRYEERLTFYDADYKKYGRGATEVRIFQNPKN